MSDMEINRVLAQMRALKSELQTVQPEQTGGPDFSDVMKQAVGKVNEQQATAESMVNAFEAGTGDASVAEVMVQMQKASLSFQAMTEVRNKLVDAYREVMNMPL